MNIATIIFIGLLGLGTVGYILWRYRSEGSGWVDGPLVRGKNYSKGISLKDVSDTRFKVVIRKGAELDGITKARKALKTHIRFRYRVTGTGLYPNEFPHLVPTLTPYFSTDDNKWSGAGKDNWNRWFTIGYFPLTEGYHEVVVPFDPTLWCSVMGPQAHEHLGEFQAALAKNGRVGLAYGSLEGRMHGVNTNTDVEFELLDWEAI